MPHPSPWPSREALETAILAFIAQHGFTQWSLRTLATGLGVSTYTLTYHFGSKDQLLGVILAKFEGQMQAMMQQWAIEPGMTTAQLLRRFCDWLLAPENTSFGQTLFEIYGQALRHPDQYAELVASGFPTWIRLIEQRLEVDGLRIPAPEVVASVLVASVTGIYLDWLTLHDAPRTSQTVAYLCQWIEQILRSQGSEGADQKIRDGC